MTLTDLPTPTFGGGYDGEARPRMGFFTDTSICIGCKACEVACKEWNLVPERGPLELSGTSYDNTMALGANTCDVLPGRRPRGPALVELVEGHRARALAEQEREGSR